MSGMRSLAFRGVEQCGHTEREVVKETLFGKRRPTTLKNEPSIVPVINI